MSKEEFLAAIRQRIAGLPQSDIDKSLDFYSEMIDDYLEDGLTMEQAIKAMGTVDEIASQILMATPLPKLMKAKAHPSRALRAWEIVLLVLGSPIWASLLLMVACVILSVYIVIWSVVVVLYCADLSFAISGVAGIIGGVALMFIGNHFQAAFLLGTALICIGVSILLFFAFNKATKGIVALSKLIIMKIKSLFIKRGDAK